jgi:hypothetical protein
VIADTGAPGIAKRFQSAAYGLLGELLDPIQLAADTISSV